ncbi:hypothetical protein ACG7TL_004097 [Trametes sanguinea]
MALCENSIEIDDTDESIRYSGPWQSFSDQSYGFNGTRRYRSWAQCELQIQRGPLSAGTCVIVTGIIGSNGSLPMPPTTFILDGHFTQMNTSATAPGTPFPGAPEFSQSLFYIALTVLEGEHELIITNLGANASVPLMLDGFIITPPGGDDGGRGVGAANASSTSTSTSTLSSSIRSPSSSSTVAGAAASSASSSTSPSDTPAIVGGTIGGVAGLLLVLALAGVFVWRRYARLSRRNDPEVVSDIRPFAAWRGGASPSGSAAILGTFPAEKPRLSPAMLAPAGSASAASGSRTSLHPSAAMEPSPPVPLHQNNFSYEDAKAHPPEYTP